MGLNKREGIPAAVDREAEPEENVPDQEKPVPQMAEIQKKRADVVELDGRISVLAKEVEAIRTCIKNSEAVGISSLELSDKQEKLMGEIESLEGEKSAWVDENGEQELPEGVSVAEGQDGWGTKLNLDRDQAEKMSQEQRRKFVDEWEKRSVTMFSNHLQSNWRCKGAINLELAMEIVKNNVPLAIEKQSKGFLTGESDVLPDFVVMHVKANSLLDNLRGKPNMIRELKIDFQGKSEILADESKLIEEDKIEAVDSSKQTELRPAA